MKKMLLHYRQNLGLKEIQEIYQVVILTRLIRDSRDEKKKIITTKFDFFGRLLIKYNFSQN